MPHDLIPKSAFRAIFEAIPSPCLILEASSDFTIVGANTAYLTATMTRLHDIVGKPVFAIFPDNPDNPAASGVEVARQSFMHVVASCEMDVLPVQRYDIRRPGKDDEAFEERYWSIKNIPVADANGKVVYVFHMTEDVTDFVDMTRQLHDAVPGSDELKERIQALETEMFHRARERHEINLRLREANAALVRLDEAKAAFFTDVSHEFRTPLTLILGPLEDELAESTTPLPPQRRERLELAYRNSQRLLTLDNCLLDFARVVSGKADAAYEPTDLAALTADVAANFRGLCEKAGLNFNVDCALLPEPVYVDRAMWEKIVLNLLSNAFKFTLEGGITIRISAEKNTALLEVRDTGSGIPAAELSEVFERFHKVRGARGRSMAGAGVGLSLTRELVRLHGGEIQVASTAGLGSSFQVRIPFGKAHLPEEAIVEDVPLSAAVKEAAPFVKEAVSWLPLPEQPNHDSLVEASAGRSGSWPRILVAEDDADLLRYIERLLKENYAVVTAADGDQALANALQERPDLVLSDSTLPGLDGLGLLRALRADPKTRTVPFILLSARASDEDRLAGRLAGADDYLTKPFNTRELLAHIKVNLELARLRGETPHPPPLAPATPAPAAILVVDDNADEIDYLTMLLGNLGHQVRSADNGDTALAMVRELKPDLVITDLLMPHVDGFEFIRRLRHDPETAATRVIVLTSTFRDRSAETLSEALKVARYLRKPLSSQALVTAVTEVLQVPAATPAIPENLLHTLSATYRSLMSAAFFAKEADLLREIEARRVVEGELRNREQQLQLALQIGRIGSFEIDFATNRLKGSAELATLCGMPAAPFESDIDTLMRKRVHPDDLAGVNAHVAEARSLGKFEHEWRTVWPDGTVRWLAGRAAAVNDGSAKRQRMLGVDIDITDHKEAENIIRRASQHDPLTNLPNRALFHELAEHLLAGQQRAKQPAALLFIDLDSFKPVNDNYGHAVGDSVLIGVSQRLVKCLRGEDVVGRVGGDEFVAALGHIRDEENAGKVAAHVLESLVQPHVVNGIKLLVPPSIGISLFPRDGRNVSALVRCADTAMYAVKKTGANAYRFYEPSLNRTAQEALRIERRLSKALENSEFELAWLPVMDLENGTIVGAEALLRWPSMGLPPGRFIPVAETMGIMPALCQWVLNEACRVRQAWRQHGLPDFPVSVNISANEFRHPDFLHLLASVMAQGNLQAGDLRLEINENALGQRLDEAIVSLQAIRELGVRVGLDDFGSGVTSLKSMVQMPFDTIKLDQSFVHQLGQKHPNALLMDNVLSVAQAIGIAVVAEGIDSEESLDFAKIHHCPQGQGFLFTQPLTWPDFEVWYQRRAA